MGAILAVLAFVFVLMLIKEFFKSLIGIEESEELNESEDRGTTKVSEVSELKDRLNDNDLYFRSYEKPETIKSCEFCGDRFWVVFESTIDQKYYLGAISKRKFMDELMEKYKDETNRVYRHRRAEKIDVKEIIKKGNISKNKYGDEVSIGNIKIYCIDRKFITGYSAFSTI